MSPVQSVVPGIGITPWPMQKASRPASTTDPELVVFDPLLLLLLELTADGNNSPPWPPIAPELPDAAPPLPLFDEELPGDEHAAGIPNAQATTHK